MYIIVFFVIALVGAGIHLALDKQPRTGKRIVEIFLLWVLVICVGVNGLFAFYGHAFRADETARAIGWPTGSPFQFEIAITNLVLGILGILRIWIRGTFWYATGFAQAIFGLGARPMATLFRWSCIRTLLLKIQASSCSVKLRCLSSFSDSC